MYGLKRFVNFPQQGQINSYKSHFHNHKIENIVYLGQQFTINLTDNCMKQNRKRYTQGLQDPLEKTQQLYDPFSRPITNFAFLNKKISKNYEELKCSATLFEDSQDQSTDGRASEQPHQKQVELNVMKQINNVNFRSNKAVTQKNDSAVESSKDNNKILNKIIANQKNQKSKIEPVQKENQNKVDPPYGFNENFRVVYPQTPGFKNLLHSPFGKFNSLFKQIILTLSKQRQIDPKPCNPEPIQLLSSPLEFYNKSKLSFDCSKYFNGISLKLKQMNFPNQSIFFSCLSCYADPFNSYSWKRYVNQVEQLGKLSRAFVLAKTGFLLTQNQQLAKTFISLGERCGMEIYKIQGIMCSISSPEAYEKTLLPESCKLEIKFAKSWKGIRLLWEICKVNDYKLSVCINTLFLSRYLQNIDFQEKGKSILRASFSKSMSKLEIYLQYLEMSIRMNNGLLESELQQVLKYLDCISGQNRYKLLLEIAQILFKNNDQRFYNFIGNSYQAALEYCAVGAGCNKALKQIYYTVAKLKMIQPRVKEVLGDNLIFEINRRKFVNGEPLLQHEFEDWKYYLHYGVIKRYDLLAEAARKWPLTGRIIAQWIHSLRSFRSPLEMLKIWRDKIDQVPKSGQLWCEGGRIYVQLREYNNAQKCFRCAMHFTPQYGDSFIEQLKLLLRQNRLLQIQKLRKLFLVSEPFYGHVLSYLRFHHWKRYSLSLNQVWKNAVYEISQDFYKHNNENGKNLTAYAPYNHAYIYNMTAQERQILFYSYQQMENKN